MFEEQLEKIVGGGAVKGTHIANVTVEISRAAGGKVPYQE